MPNEFEKQVQQMMDELKLVPSEPVWQKVELQIRKKKDRRRVIFWMVFLALLLGGGMWFELREYSNKVAYKKSSVTEKGSKKEVDNNLPVANTTQPIDQKTSGHSVITPGNRKQNEKTGEELKTQNKDVVINIEPGVQRNISKELKESSVKTEKEITEKLEKTESDNTEVNKVVAIKPIENNLEQPLSNSDTLLRKNPTNVIAIDTKKNDPAILSVPDSLKQDTASTNGKIQKQDTAAGLKKADIKKYATSKWKLNLVTMAGSSNLGRLELFNGQKSFVAASYNSGGSQSGGLPLYYGPSDVKEGFSCSIGVVAKKQVAKRTFFSSGLRYNYYSNTIQVGNKINQSRTLMDFNVSQYYSNTGISLQPYHNRYHFVSVPVAMDWQLLKKAPLNFYAGLSMQYLIKTNGLVFDNTTQSYFNSKDAFNRIQLFFEPTLTYSVSFQQKVLTFGPQLQYGLTTLEKNNSAYHLTSYGLKAQLQFGKK